MIVVKLGGSVITDKAAPTPTPRPDVVARLARELAAGPRPLVVVHGAGSFGHPVARRHGFSTTPSPGTDAGAREVRASVRALDAQVIGALAEAGADAAPLDPATVFRVRRGAIDGVDHARVRTLLQRGRIPVCFGDLVPDLDAGWVVLSGDDVAIGLARALDATRLLFVTDVDGLLTRPPGSPDARLIERLDAADGAAVSAAPSDVTGGLARKVRLVRRAAGPGLTIGIVNGRVAGRLADALTGTPVGTWVAP